MSLRASISEYLGAQPVPWGFLSCGVIYWCLLLFFSLHGMAPVGEDSAAAGFFGHAGSLHLMGTVFALLVAIIFESRGDSSLAGSLWVLLGTAALLVGLVLCAVESAGLLSAELRVGELLLGFGMGLMLIQLADAFACFTLPRALFYVGLEAVAAAPLSLVLVLLLPEVAGFCCLIACTLVQAVLFVRNRRVASPVDQRVPHVEWRSNRRRAVMVFVTVAFCGLCIGFTLAAVPKQGELYPVVNFVALAVAGLLLGGMSAQLLNQWAEELMFKTCIPLVALALLCYALLRVSPLVPVFACAVCAFCLTGFVWFFAAEYHAESQVGLRLMAAVLFAMVFTCQLLGMALGFQAAGNETLARVVTAVLLFGMVVLLLTATLGYEKRVMESMKLLDDYRKGTMFQQIADEHGLTDREKEVLGLLMEGLATKQIAADLVISENTVNTHIRCVFKKMGVHSRAELAEYLEGRTGPLRNIPGDGVPFLDE